MSELLGAIRAAPADDAPRLVYADWVSEQGDPARGELIRVQCAKAALDPWQAEVIELTLRERELLAEHGERWRGALPSMDGVVWGHFGRGFADTLAFASGEALAAHGETCLRACPASHVLVGWPRLGEREALAALEGLHRLTVFGTLLDPDDMRWLAESELLSTVRELVVFDSRMDVASLEVLLDSPFAAQWESLSVVRHALGVDGVGALVGRELPSLRALDLSVATADELNSGRPGGDSIGSDGARALAGWVGLKGVRRLSLDGHRLPSEGLATLLESSHLASLERLSLRGMEARGHYDLGASRRDLPEVFAGLDSLRLSALHMGQVGIERPSAEALACSPALSELAMLGLDRVHADQEVLEVLFGGACMAGVQVVRASEGTEVLVRALMSQSPPSLHTLDLSPTFYRARGILRALADGPPLPSLRVLDIDHASNYDRGFEEDFDAMGGWLPAIESGETLPALECLWVERGWEEEEDDDDFWDHDPFLESPLGMRLRGLELGLPGDRAPRPRLPSLDRERRERRCAFDFGVLRLIDPGRWY